MSWHVKVVGPRAAVKAAIQAHTQLPEGIKQTVAQVCDDVGQFTPAGVLVETAGHLGGGYSSVTSLKIENVDLAAPPPANEEQAGAITGTAGNAKVA